MERPGTEIPKFDLAQEIMAKQRKLTATRRKAPVEKLQSLPKQNTSKLPLDPSSQPAHLSSEQQRIIAEIVARDIQRLLCNGNLLTFGC